MNRYLVALGIILVIFTPRAAADARAGALRGTYFEETARLAELRGDRDAASMLRRIGSGPAQPPPELSAQATSRHPDYAGEYTDLRLRDRQAILAPAHAPSQQWRVDRAEADLHLAAYELEKGAWAPMALVGSLLVDASYALDHQIIPYGASPEVSPPPTARIEANPARVESGKSSVVAWTTTNATKAQINEKDVELAGNMTVYPTGPMTFDLVATGPGGRATDSATITIYYPSPTAKIDVHPNVIDQGKTSMLVWNSTNATSVVINGKPEALSGGREVSPPATTTYDMTATGPGGEAMASTVLTVIPPVAPRHYRIHFDFDESVIRPDALDTMAAVARLLRENPDMMMKVEGHCDWIGTDEYNMALGMRRAQSVRDFFVERYGLSPATFVLVSKGEAEPIAPNANPDGSDNPEGRQLNRRAEFIEILP